MSLTPSRCAPLPVGARGAAGCRSDNLPCPAVPASPPPRGGSGVTLAAVGEGEEVSLTPSRCAPLPVGARGAAGCRSDNLPCPAVPASPPPGGGGGVTLAAITLVAAPAPIPPSRAAPPVRAVRGWGLGCLGNMLTSAGAPAKPSPRRGGQRHTRSGPPGSRACAYRPWSCTTACVGSGRLGAQQHKHRTYLRSKVPFPHEGASASCAHLCSSCHTPMWGGLPASM